MKKCAILALTTVMTASILTVPAKALSTQPQGIVEGGCVLKEHHKDYCDIPSSTYMPLVYGLCAPGDHSRDVQILQCKLTKLGYNDLDEVRYYGPKTVKAVSDFQEKLGLEVDGIVSRDLWYVIMAA